MNIHALSSSPTAQETLKITVTGQTPLTTNDTGYIYEDSALNVISDRGSVNTETGTDDNNNNESGDHTGNVMINDTDPENSAITITSALTQI